MYFIYNHLTQAADKLSISRTGPDMRRVSPIERMMVIYTSSTAYTGIKTIADDNKSHASCRFFDHNCEARLTMWWPHIHARRGLSLFLFPSL